MQTSCDAFHLQSGMWVVYSDYLTVAVSSAVDVDSIYLETDLTLYLVEDCDAKRINDISSRDDQGSDEDREGSDDDDPRTSQYDEDEDDSYGPVAFQVQRVTKPSTVNVFKSAYVTYGNEPQLAHAYGHISLFVEVVKPGSRATAKE